MTENKDITDNIREISKRYYKLLQSECEVAARRIPCPYHDGDLGHAYCIYGRVLAGETYGRPAIIGVMAYIKKLEDYYIRTMLTRGAQAPIVINKKESAK